MRRRRAECAESDPVKISGVKNCLPFFGHAWAALVVGPAAGQKQGAADDKFPILPRRHSAFLAPRMCVSTRSPARIVGLVSYLWTLFDWLASVRPHSFARPPYLGGRDWESRWTHSASASRADTCRQYVQIFALRLRLAGAEREGFLPGDGPQFNVPTCICIQLNRGWCFRWAQFHAFGKLYGQFLALSWLWHGPMPIHLSKPEFVSAVTPSGMPTDIEHGRVGRMGGLDGWKDARGSPPPPSLTRARGSSVDGLDKVAHVEPLWAP